MSKTGYVRQSVRATAQRGCPGQAVAEITAPFSYALAICQALHTEGFLYSISCISHNSPITWILITFSKSQVRFTDEKTEA